MQEYGHLTNTQLTELFNNTSAAHDFMLEEAAWKVFFDQHFKHVTEDEAVTIQRAYQEWQEKYQEHIKQFGKPDCAKIIAGYKTVQYGHPLALTRLATLYEAGTHVPQDYPLAISLYNNVIYLLHEPLAMCNRANMHKEGRGGPVNLIAAAELLRKSCNSKNPQLTPQLQICTWIDRENNSRLILKSINTTETLKSAILKEFASLIDLSRDQTLIEVKYHYEYCLNGRESLNAYAHQNMDRFCVLLANDEVAEPNDKYYTLLSCASYSIRDSMHMIQSNQALFSIAVIIIKHAEVIFRLAPHNIRYYLDAPNYLKEAHPARSLLKERVDKLNDVEAKKLYDKLNEKIIIAMLKMKHPDQKIDDTFECAQLLRSIPYSMLATLTLAKKLLSINLEPYFSLQDRYHLLLTLIHQAYSHHPIDPAQLPEITFLFIALDFPDDVKYDTCAVALCKSICANVESEPDLPKIQAELVMRLDELINFTLSINAHQNEANKKAPDNDRVFNSAKQTVFELEDKIPKGINQRALLFKEFKRLPAIRTALKNLIDKPIVQSSYWGLYSSSVTPDPELEKLLKYCHQIDATVEQFIDRLIDYLPFCVLTEGHREFMLELIREMPQSFTGKDYSDLSLNKLRDVFCKELQNQVPICIVSLDSPRESNAIN